MDSTTNDTPPDAGYDLDDIPPPPAPVPPSTPAAPPVDVTPDVEHALLGAVLVNPEHVELLQDAVRLLGRRNGLIAQAMLDLHASGLDPGDVALLREQLGWRFDEAGGQAYLAHLMLGVPKSANAPHYLSQLRAARGRRTAAQAAQAAADALAAGDSVSTGRRPPGGRTGGPRGHSTQARASRRTRPRSHPQ